MKHRAFTLIELLVVIFIFFQCISTNATEINLDQKIPLDKEITYGKLDNGFTYYIKKNTSPKKKATIHLIVKAGSLMEDDDQLGLAHLIEHMVFNGTKNFVETCPHYLTLSNENQEGYLAKVMPPIRSESDVLSVWNAINQNHVNTIGTDHVANQLKLKLDGNTVWDALAGFPGIGTLLPLMLSEGVNKNRISISQLANLTSTNAAKIFGMYPAKGSLELNSDADITLIDLKKEQKVTSDLFGGFSDYVVYDGWKLKGWPVKTIVRGQTIAEDFQVIGKPGYGKLVSRKTNST